MSIKEPITSRRIQVINTQTSDIHEDGANLNETLVDRDRAESVELIESIRTRLNLLKEQLTNGDIV